MGEGEKTRKNGMKENLWRWRDRDGGKTINGKEKRKKTDEKTAERKLRFIEET